MCMASVRTTRPENQRDPDWNGQVQSAVQTRLLCPAGWYSIFSVSLRFFYFGSLFKLKKIFTLKPSPSPYLTVSMARVE